MATEQGLSACFTLKYSIMSWKSPWIPTPSPTGRSPVNLLQFADALPRRVVLSWNITLQACSERGWASTSGLRTRTSLAFLTVSQCLLWLFCQSLSCFHQYGVQGMFLLFSPVLKVSLFSSCLCILYFSRHSYFAWGLALYLIHFCVPSIASSGNNVFNSHATEWTTASGGSSWGWFMAGRWEIVRLQSQTGTSIPVTNGWRRGRWAHWDLRIKHWTLNGRTAEKEITHPYKRREKNDWWVHPFLSGNSSWELMTWAKLFCLDESQPACQKKMFPISLDPQMPAPLGSVFHSPINNSSFLCTLMMLHILFITPFDFSLFKVFIRLSTVD